MFNLISKREIDDIDSIACLYGSQDSEYYVLKDKLLEPIEKRFVEWHKQKTNFLYPCIFKDKLVYEKEIDLELPIGIKFDKSSLFDHDFAGQYRMFIVDNVEKFAKLNNITGVRIIQIAFDLLSKESLIDNIYRGETFKLITPGKRILTVQKGCKTIKALGKIASAFRLKYFEDFRLQHSMLKNEQRVNGTLCISIHPLDYLTLSDNYYNWTSCYSIENYGEYRISTIETMNSPHMVVAYLKGESEKEPYNKKWRELFVVSPWVLMGIKGYPFHNEILEKEAMNFIMETAQSNGFSYSSGTIYSDKIFENFYFDFNNVYDDFSSLLEPVPMKYAKNYSPFYADGSKKSYKDKPRVIIGGKATCLVCGRSFESYSIKGETEYESCLICPDCENIIECSKCHEFVFDKEEDGNYYYDKKTNEYICVDCLERGDYVFCDRCGTLLNLNYHTWEQDEDTGEILCGDCIEEREEYN